MRPLPRRAEMEPARIRSQIRVERIRAAVTLTSHVQALRHHPLLRVSLVGLLLVSWLIFTNHCALGMMRPAPQAATAPTSCCGGKKPPKPDAPAGPLECCKIKVARSSAKAELTKPAAPKFQIPLPVLLPAPDWQPAETSRTAFADGHGPPRCLSFAESVLQRSLLSHAPPLAV